MFWQWIKERLLVWINGLNSKAISKSSEIDTGIVSNPQLPPPKRETPEPDEGHMVRLGVIVGHEKLDQGAELKPQKITEYAYNTLIASKMSEYASEVGGVDVRIIFRDGLGIHGAYKRAESLKCDACIELHFNSYDGKVVGTETLTTPDDRDVEFGLLVHREICKVFHRNGQSRGVKPIPKAARGGLNVHSFPGGPNCLVEPFFGDTPSESTMALAFRDEYAKALVLAVKSWAMSKGLL